MNISGEILPQSQICHYFPIPKPSSAPSRAPSKAAIPSVKPSKKPSSAPSRVPSKLPSVRPSVKPSKRPSSAPSRVPSKRPSMMPSPIGCVTDEAELQASVRNIPNNSLTLTTIEICANYISLNVNQPNGSIRYSGINLINKLVHFQCTLHNASERCIIDAQQGSRHFYILNTTASFNRIVFKNGNVTEERFNSGESFWINLSTIQVSECSFIGGTSVAGGAIYVHGSTIDLYNSNFLNNTAKNGGGLVPGSIQF